MSFSIRPYRHSDFEMIASWWDAHGEIGPLPGMLVEDGTFVLEHDGTPIMSVTVYLTQASIAYLEAIVSAPGVDKSIRHRAGEQLFAHAYEYAADKGKRHLLTYSNKPKLVSRYESLGMTRSPVGGLQGMYRILR